MRVLREWIRRAAIGVAGGLAFGRFAQTLLFGIKPTDGSTLVVPVLTLFCSRHSRNALTSYPGSPHRSRDHAAHRLAPRD
jgi:hypothetical protein